ncbi:hypothetical protein M0R45_017624 [Rubus argutus]|uniref:Transmembrane protein n=1 Tax=Rubus argutus TaxID=59490 RepID=A0AAW1XYW7_RUBAR
MRSNQPPQCEDLPVVLSDPDIEKQVSPLTLPNGVVPEPPKATATATATATASRRVLTFCWAYLILLLCLLVFGVVAASISIPALQFHIIYGVFVVLAFGSALGLSLSCCHAMGVVERANRNAKNVPVGNHSGV